MQYGHIKIFFPSHQQGRELPFLKAKFHYKFLIVREHQRS